MKVIEITHMALAEPPSALLHTCHISAPGDGEQFDGESFTLTGRVLGRDVPAVAIEVLEGATVIGRAPLQRVAANLAAAEHGAFRTIVSFAGRKPPVALGLQAVLADQRRAPFATLQLRQSWWDGADDGAKPTVAVIIPCANQAHILGEAIESAMHQTHPHVEIVVVDSGSIDNTAAVAARYPGVRYVGPGRQGPAEARNSGLQRSNGSYVVVLDAADRLLPHAVETGLAALEAHPEAAFAYGHWRRIAFDGAPLPSPPAPPDEDDAYAALLKGCHILTPGVVMYRRGVFRALGGFDPAAGAATDYDLYLRIARQAPIVGHRTVIAEYRTYSANTNAGAARIAQAQTAVLRRQWQYVRGKPDLHEAYGVGLRHGRTHRSAPLLEVVRARRYERLWPRLLPSLLTLVWRYPEELVEIVAEFLRTQLTKRSV